MGSFIPCTCRPNNEPCEYGHTSDCMYCGDPMPSEPVAQSSTAAELGFGRRMLFLLVFAILVSGLVMLSGCASQTWSRRDSIGESAVFATLAIDAYQTSRIRDHEGYEEIGSVRPFCGPRPSPGCTAQYFVASALTHWLIAKSLPPSWRPYWQGAAVAVEARVIYRNHAVGIR